MSGELGFTCSTCGELHATPLSFHPEAPEYWTPAHADDPASQLTSDQCVIAGEHFFLRGLIEIPVLDTGEVFSWGAWVSLSEASFLHIDQRWYDEDRHRDEPSFGWLSTELPGYLTTTINLKTLVHTRPVGVRPLIEVEPTDHPLAREQHYGITAVRLREIVEQQLHPAPEI